MTLRRIGIMVVLLGAVFGIVAWLIQSYYLAWGYYNPDVFSDTGDRHASTTSSAFFLHDATPENISASSTYLDHPLANDNPDAVVYVTQNWNPAGDAGVYNDHHVGVWYDFDRRSWAIFNQDRAAMPEGASFNMAIVEEPSDAS